MKNNVMRLGVLAVRMATVLAAYSAGAITISPSVETHGGGFRSESGIVMSGSLSDTALASEFTQGPPTRISTETSSIWPGTTPSPNPGSGQQPALEYANPSRALGNGIAGKSSGIPASDFDSLAQPVDYRNEHPLQGESDFAAWKSTSGTPINNPEDWLFQMQFSQDPNSQRSEPEPFIPVPEPASGVVMLLGLAGLAMRRKRSQ